MVRIHNTYTNMRCRTAMCSVLIRAVPWKWRASEEKSISVKMNRRQESINRINKYVESAHFHRKCWKVMRYDNKIVIHFEGAALNLIIKLCIHIVAHLRYHDAWLSFVLRTYLHFVCYPISSNLCCSLLRHVVFLFFHLLSSIQHHFQLLSIALVRTKRKATFFQIIVHFILQWLRKGKMLDCSIFQQQQYSNQPHWARARWNVKQNETRKWTHLNVLDCNMGCMHTRNRQKDARTAKTARISIYNRAQSFFACGWSIGFCYPSLGRRYGCRWHCVRSSVIHIFSGGLEFLPFKRNSLRKQQTVGPIWRIMHWAHFPA